jgi:hypothetical protein
MATRRHGNGTEGGLSDRLTIDVNDSATNGALEINASPAALAVGGRRPSAQRDHREQQTFRELVHGLASFTKWQVINYAPISVRYVHPALQLDP